MRPTPSSFSCIEIELTVTRDTRSHYWLDICCLRLHYHMIWCRLGTESGKKRRWWNFSPTKPERAGVAFAASAFPSIFPFLFLFIFFTFFPNVLSLLSSSLFLFLSFGRFLVSRLVYFSRLFLPAVGKLSFVFFSNSRTTHLKKKKKTSSCRTVAVTVIPTGKS